MQKKTSKLLTFFQGVFSFVAKRWRWQCKAQTGGKNVEIVDGTFNEKDERGGTFWSGEQLVKHTSVLYNV